MLEKSSSRIIRRDTTETEFDEIHDCFKKLGLTSEDFRDSFDAQKRSRAPLLLVFTSIALLFVSFSCQCSILDYIFGVRCLVPNNYFIWEATRPISDCSFCSNVTQPVILRNVTREEFAPYTYSSGPIVIRGAFLHWPAVKSFNFQYFKKLYDSVDDSYRSVDEECQFLHFRSDFISLRDVFEMSEARVNNFKGEKSWYVGWGNCHATILEEMRKEYPKPHFLPEDSESPYKDYVFMGYSDGATMHLDYINRLMWQAQLKGSKYWNLLPPPECQNLCKPIEFYVHPGDAVLLDTRIWYHATTISPGEFSLSVQSEYG